MNLRTTNALCYTMRDLFNKNKLTTYEYIAFTTLCYNLKSDFYVWDDTDKIFRKKE